jgi:hypothetical protein
MDELENGKLGETVGRFYWSFHHAYPPTGKGPQQTDIPSAKCSSGYPFD